MKNDIANKDKKKSLAKRCVFFYLSDFVNISQNLATEISNLAKRNLSHAAIKLLIQKLIDAKSTVSLNKQPKFKTQENFGECCILDR